MARIVIAPDSFKGSISSSDAAHAIAQGWLSIRPSDEVIEIPFATFTLAKVAVGVPDTETTSPFLTVFNTGVPVNVAVLFPS
jgi:glycerate kinase